VPSVVSTASYREIRNLREGMADVETSAVRIASEIQR
jgi:hypothetical protein